MSDHEKTEEPDTTKAEKSEGQTEGGPTNDERTMFVVEDEELA